MKAEGGHEKRKHSGDETEKREALQRLSSDSYLRGQLCKVTAHQLLPRKGERPRETRWERTSKQALGVAERVR